MDLAGGFMPAIVQSAVSSASTVTPTKTTNTYATIPEMDLTLNNLTIGNLLVAFFDGNFYHDSAGAQLGFGLSLDSAAEVDEYLPNAPGSNYIFLAHLMGMWTITTTSHNVKGRWKNNTGAGTLSSFNVARKLRLFELRT